MKNQTVMWTALPNGVTVTRAGTILKLSVFVSPRLQTDKTSPTLSLFTDFLDWPGTLFSAAAGASFSVQFGTLKAVPATRTSPSPRSDLWKALFPDTSLVESYAPVSYKNKAIQSYPAKNIQSFLKQQYVSLAATSGQEFPSADALVKDTGAPFNPLAFSLRDSNEKSLTSSLMQELDKNKYLTQGNIADPSTLAKSFIQAKLFHQPFSATMVKISSPSIDFHRMISSLGDYPVLLKSLGLVFDLEVPLQIVGDTTVQVLVNWKSRDSSVTTVNTPNDNQRLDTRCRISTSAFYALPRANSPELADGMLPFEDTDRYEVVRIDPDGAALKTLAFASNLGMARTLRKTDDTPETSSVPSLRSGGLSVARVNRAQQSHATFVRQDVLNLNMTNNTNITLDAEDITRGFTIDVWDSLSSRWHSLCQRTGTYEFTRTTPSILEKADDEGWVSAGMTSAADGSSDILRQGESLFRWCGWSLAAPRPGKTMDADGNPAPPGTEIDPNFKLAVHFKPKATSLPRLRFGVTYRMRARAVDLAGNRLAIDDKALGSDSHATKPLVYGRFEPVPPPAVVMRNRRTEGESVERLVIRSNYNQAIEAVTERHIVPPKTSQTQAEEHQLFDNTANSQVDANAYKLIISKEDGTITGQPDPDNYNRPYVNADNLELPYLPDVLSRGAALRNLPGTSAPYLFDFGYSAGARWPDALPFRLVLGESDTASVKPDSSKHILQVLLPKAELVQVRLSSFMTKDGAMQMGLIQWIIESGLSEAAVRTLAAQGLHWMLTPYRVLTLVHAVRQPLITPEFSAQLGRVRGVGQTFAEIYDRQMTVHRKSTIKLDITASWDETIDPLGEAAPRVIHGKARPYEFPVPLPGEPAEEQSLYVHGNHEFGDTKHRDVTYSAIATTRFSEYFLQRRKDVRLKGKDTFTLDAKGVVVGSEAVRLADNTANYKCYDSTHKTGDYVVDYVNGTIRRTDPSESASAIPENVYLEVTYLVPPITREMTQPKTLNILSAARPAAPRVLYIVPTFTWQMNTGSTDKKVVSSQRTGGIRIYLDRPWYTSGDGQLLGAIIWPGSTSNFLINQSLPERVKPYITQWGLDPVFQSQAADASPSLAAFPLSKPEYQAAGLVLEEVPDEKVKVNVAGHAVAYNSERRLWYCDMDIDAGQSYFPFVRLALAAYQPNSLSGAITGTGTIILPGSDNVHLSRVVLADFVQLTPNHYASITRNDSNPLLRHVSLTGRSYQMFNGQSGPGVVEISLEKQRAGLKPEEAGELVWEPVTLSDKSSAVTLGHNLVETDKTGNTTWTGDITLPDGTHTYRLLVKEFEHYNEPGEIPVVRRRLVYADAIELVP